MTRSAVDATSVRPTFETLEARDLPALGPLPIWNPPPPLIRDYVITGSPMPDDIIISPGLFGWPAQVKVYSYEYAARINRFLVYETILKPWQFDRLVINTLEGDDRVLNESTTPSVINGGLGKDTIIGGHSHDLIYGDDGLNVPPGQAPFNDEEDVLYGLGGNDTIYGGFGDDVVVGFAGDDRLYGGEGDDYLEGDQGVDHLYGDAGNDTLNGQLVTNPDGTTVVDDNEVDRLEGGAGGDVFIVSTHRQGTADIVDDHIVDKQGIDTVVK